MVFRTGAGSELTEAVRKLNLSDIDEYACASESGKFCGFWKLAFTGFVPGRPAIGKLDALFPKRTDGLTINVVPQTHLFIGLQFEVQIFCKVTEEVEIDLF